jgi:Protein of unknown function (DUF2946)
MEMNPGRAWRRWLLGWVFLAFVGIQIIESTHHHESAADEEKCAVCQVAAHLPFDLVPPAAAPMAVVLFLLFVLTTWRPIFRIAKARCASYHSRAPPRLAA